MVQWLQLLSILGTKLNQWGINAVNKNKYDTGYHTGQKCSGSN